MKKIIFITPVINDSRINKRVQFFLDNKYECKVLSFEREGYSNKNQYNFISLGKIKSGNYIKRILKYLKIILKVRKQVKNYSYIYCFELDNTLLGIVASIFLKKKIIYEIADIREVFFKKNIIGKVFRKVQKYAINNVNLLVVTSQNYVDNYLTKTLNISKMRVCLLENIPVVEKVKLDKKLNDNKIKIGYFGLFRCERSLEILRRISLELEETHMIYMYGIPTGIENFNEKILKSNIKYLGEYTHKNLNEMYSSIDIVWGCYPYNKEDGNWKMARTNRFYEAIEFEKVIILQKKSGDDIATLGEMFKIVIDMDDICKSINILKSFKREELLKKEEKIEKYKLIQREKLKKQNRELLKVIENV